MGKGKVQVWIVKQQNSEPRLIRGTLREVEQLLRGEVIIEPCSVESARELHNTEIESAEGE